MSIELMSAIFNTEFPDYLACGDIRTKSSTAKLVLLAIADHANDEGESAYPGLTRLERKTGLSRQGLVDTLKVLKFNGLLIVSDTPSKLNTNNYTVVTSAYPCLRQNYDNNQLGLLVKPLDYPSQATLPVVVKPLDLNHPLTITESSLTTTTAEIFRTYEKEIGIVTQRTSEALGLWIDDPTCPSEWIIEVIKIAADQNKRNWAYCEAILKRWVVEGKVPLVKTFNGKKVTNAQAERIRKLENA